MDCLTQYCQLGIQVFILGCQVEVFTNGAILKKKCLVMPQIELSILHMRSLYSAIERWHFWIYLKPEHKCFTNTLFWSGAFVWVGVLDVFKNFKALLKDKVGFAHCYIKLPQLKHINAGYVIWKIILSQEKQNGSTLTIQWRVFQFSNFVFGNFFRDLILCIFQV